MITLENVYKFYFRNHLHKVVLNHVSANFNAGTSYAILGLNGAGKSTLIKILAGAELPNDGRVRRTARISWPLGFSGGMHPALTGRENVRFICRAYGEDYRRVLRFVQDFAEVGPYFDMPLATYSSGMRSRMSFGLSLAIQFDCYLIDETLSVGDSRFKERCRVEFESRRKHADIVMASHSMNKVTQYCHQAYVLANGRLHRFSDLQEAIEYYEILNTISPATT